MTERDEYWDRVTNPETNFGYDFEVRDRSYPRAKQVMSDLFEIAVYRKATCAYSITSNLESPFLNHHGPSALHKWYVCSQNDIEDGTLSR